MNKLIMIIIVLVSASMIIFSGCTTETILEYEESGVCGIDGGCGMEDVERDEDHDEEYEGLLEDFEVSPPGLFEKVEGREDIIIIDVRQEYEYEIGHIEGSLLLPLGEISKEVVNRLELDKDDEIILVDSSGRRSKIAYEMFIDYGFTNAKSLYGGVIHWEEDQFPIVEEVISTDGPRIVFDKSSHDFGEITQYGGTVSSKFLVINDGNEDLEILSISTSCGCTTAKIAKELIMPGENAELEVTLDPDFHSEPEGRFRRTVFLETNDPTKEEAQIKIYVDIIEEK